MIGSPELNHWHHDKNRDAGNYANISPIMDKIFGTYVCPDHEPKEFGINENFPKNYIGQLVHPLLPEWINNRLFPKKKNELAGDVIPDNTVNHGMEK